MQEFITNDKYRIKGNVSFAGLSYSYLDEEHGEVLEFKFLEKSKTIYLRFYSSIVSFRHREVFGSKDYINVEGDTNSNDKLYVVQNSEYLENLNEISGGSVSDWFSPLTHYVVFDYELEYYFDIVTNSEPEIVIKYSSKN
ncbi:MAG: hypothetical protein ACK5LM_04105 [Lactovum sp.]